MAISYEKTNWVNGGAPAINAVNLNKIEKGIEDAVNEVNGIAAHTPAGTEAELTGISLHGTNYKLAGGGLPAGTAAGNALVYDGTNWTQQTGYGYEKEIPSAAVTYTWDGDTTGKESITIVVEEATSVNGKSLANESFTLYKIADSVDCWEDGTGSALVKGEVGNPYIDPILDICDTTTYPNAYFLSFFSIPGMIYAKTGGATVLGTNVPKGLWFLKYPLYNVFVKYMTINPAVVTWDGETTGKDTITVDGSTYYKLSSDVSRAHPDAITAATYQTYWLLLANKGGEDTPDVEVSNITTFGTTAKRFEWLPEDASENVNGMMPEWIIMATETSTILGAEVPAGIWCTKNNPDNWYLSSLIYDFGPAFITYPIDSKYLSEAALTAGDGLAIEDNTISIKGSGTAVNGQYVLTAVFSGEEIFLNVPIGSAYDQSGSFGSLYNFLTQSVGPGTSYAANGMIISGDTRYAIYGVTAQANAQLVVDSISTNGGYHAVTVTESNTGLVRYNMYKIYNN